MKNDVEKVLDDFVETPEIDGEVKKENKNTKKIILDERDGLIIERIDKVFVTSDGRQLLREVY